MLLTKTTAGFVIQTFDTDKQTCVSQEFVVGDNVTYEDQESGDAINRMDFEDRLIETKDLYFPFDMVQPPSTSEDKMDDAN
jgi:hypothetical protein